MKYDEIHANFEILASFRGPGNEIEGGRPRRVIVERQRH
jgi:hypothetical protein